MPDHPVLFLIPAMPCDADLYAAQVAGLADLVEPRVMVLDEPTMAESAAALLAAAPARFLLGGTAYGGALALEIAMQAPDRIEGLWLMNCNPGNHPDPEEAQEMSARIKAGSHEDVLAELAQAVVGSTNAVAREAFLTMARRAGPDRLLRQNQAAAGRKDHWVHLGRIKVPTLLLWGAADSLVPLAIGERMAALMPSADFVSLADCHHLPTLEQPAAATQAARTWLGRCLGPS